MEVESSDYAAAKFELCYSYNPTDMLSFDIEGSLLSGKDWQSQNLSASATLRF